MCPPTKTPFLEMNYQNIVLMAAILFWSRSTHRGAVTPTLAVVSANLLPEGELPFKDSADKVGTKLHFQ